MDTSKKLIIDASHTLTRIGVVQDGKLIQMVLESGRTANLQNRIVVGRVEKVVKNLKGAFIDFGEAKNGLLHLKQVPDCYQPKLQQGARIPVQIKKENTGDKGHKLTSFLNIQGYYLVCMLFEPEICLSKKIKDPAVRAHLKQVVQTENAGQFGFMIRTKAQDAPYEVIQKEARYLIEEAKKLLASCDYLSAGSIIRHEEPLYEQVLLDNLRRDEPLTIITNSETIAKDLEAKLILVGLGEQVTFKTYPYNENLFKLFSIEKNFDNTSKRKLWLKNGGNVIIDYTEAMTVIDVNSAKAVLGKNQEKAVVELNKLAVEETIMQALQRNLGGMLIIDLVEMKAEEAKKEVYRYAKELIGIYDRERMTAYPLTELGLLQLVRTKKYSSVKDLLGVTPNTLAVLYQLEAALKTLSLNSTQEKVYLYCHPTFRDILEREGWHQKFVETYKIALSYEVDKSFKADFYEIKYHLR